MGGNSGRSGQIAGGQVGGHSSAAGHLQYNTLAAEIRKIYSARVVTLSSALRLLLDSEKKYSMALSAAERAI